MRWRAPSERHVFQAKPMASGRLRYRLCANFLRVGGGYGRFGIFGRITTILVCPGVVLALAWDVSCGVQV